MICFKCGQPNAEIKASFGFKHLICPNKFSEVENLAKTLLPSGWSFQWSNRLINTFGRCNYREKLIEISNFLASKNSTEVVKEVLLHEVAHILTPYCNHNETWKNKLIELGGTGKQYYCSEMVNEVMKKNV